MMRTITELCRKYREVLLYLVFGVLTTAVNFAVYWAAARATGHTVFSTCLAWILSVLFAYFTNRRWVFESKAAGNGAIAREMISFFGARLFSGLLDVGIMYVFVDLLHWNDSLVKLGSNVLVVVLNYLFSKLFIFKKRR